MSDVPGLRQQAVMAAGHVQSTLTDKEKRDYLAAEVTKHVTDLATLTKSHLTEPEKRSKLLDYARNIATQALAAAKDPAQRQALLDKVNYTTATLYECIKDPSKRQEVHDQLAAATHQLLQSAGATGAGAATDAAHDAAGVPAEEAAAVKTLEAPAH